MIRRWINAEKCFAKMENALVNIECEDGSVQEQRIENFYDLYDKLCQAFDIFLEHEVSKFYTTIMVKNSRNQYVRKYSNYQSNFMPDSIYRYRFG